MATDVGTGTILTLGTSALTTEILNVDWSGYSVEDVGTSHLGTTGGRTYIPTDTYEPGEVTCEVHHDGAGSDVFPTLGVAETITVDWAGGTAWTASGYVKSYEPSAPFDEKMTATLTLKISGTITTSTGV